MFGKRTKTKKQKLISELDSLKEYFSQPDKQDLESKANEIITSLYAISEAANVEISRISVLPFKTLKFIYEIQIAIEIIGDWKNLVIFLYQIEQPDNPLSISQLEVKMADDSSDQMQADILISRIFLNKRV